MADFTADQLREYARTGVAMPDESYPIPDSEHLDKAIRAVGRGTNNTHAAIRRHIMNRASKLGLDSRIPDTWNADGTLKLQKVDLRSPLWKGGTDHMVYGVVLSPGVEDSQGDIASAEVIVKAAHHWLAEFREHDIQHSGNRRPDIVPVESFIAPVDFMITDPAGVEHRVLKGAWVLGARVDGEVKQRVEKGELTGWSIEGSAVRVPA